MLGLRSWLRSWLGVTEVAEHIADLREDAKKWDDDALEEYRRDTRMHMALVNKGTDNNEKRMADIQSALSYRIDVVAKAFQDMREAAKVDVVVVDKPLMCPAGHTGITMVVPIAHFDAGDPSKSEVVGGGFFCPKCGSNFYADRDGRWLAAEATVAVGETAQPRAAAQPTGPRLRTRRGE